MEMNDKDKHHKSLVLKCRIEKLESNLNREE